MKKTVLFPIALIAVFVLIVGSACGFSIGKDANETQEPEVIVITATPGVQIPQATEAPVVVVTEEPAVVDEAQPYFLEEFDGGLDNYWYDVWGTGNPDNVEIFTEDGALRFVHSGEDVYSYLYYDPYTYGDVRIDLEAENLATNDNSVNIVCRYDEELGWYEYNIDNDGEWTLWYYDNVIYQGYKELYDGGSTAINMGRDTNIYTVICQGDEMSLYINNVLTRTVENKDLKEGLIAVGVSSYGSYPVKININWLEISEP
jgi:hypothetical protein